MKRRILYFTGPRSVEIEAENVPALEPNEVLVESHVSAISPGTEMLIYRGQTPTEMPTDTTISHLSGTLSYPLTYGYALVGQVIDGGEEVDDDWLDNRVFLFHPHASHAVVDTNELIPIPEKLTDQQAALLPTMETAVNLVMDGQPVIGERVAIFGQGVVGLLTTHLLDQFPLSKLIAVEPIPERRKLARDVGATHALAPVSMAGSPHEAVIDIVDDLIDLTYELSGAPEALDRAVQVTGYGGRVIVGSWYGTKDVSLDLGSHFHRSRISILSSQVSTLDPRWRGRWTKERRLMEAQNRLTSMNLDSIVDTTVEFGSAADAYELLDEGNPPPVQVLLRY